MTAPVSITARPRSLLMALAVSGPREHGDPCTMVLFGATGDLARRKLMACIYDLEKVSLLDDDFRLLGVDRNPMSDEAFREIVKKSMSESDEVHGFEDGIWKKLEGRIHYVGGNLLDAEVYVAMRDRLVELEASSKPERRSRMFYLSVPPAIFD